MSRSYCEVCGKIDTTGLGICAECADESDLNEQKE